MNGTYRVVGEAIDAFLAPVVTGAPATTGVYRPLATGQLTADIEARRGHCKQIAQRYIESGGLRESVPASVGNDVLDQLDDLVLLLSRRDDDLFDAMVSIGDALRDEAAVLTNLLLANQREEATARLVRAEQTLLPLRQEINQGMADVERLAGELGVQITGPEPAAVLEAGRSARGTGPTRGPGPPVVQQRP